ncbi:MAG: sulfurtransferase [Opitutales bacterium]|nr:sulfurtransferase [Opitutales bacterium]
MNNKFLVSAEWLNNHSGRKNLKIVETPWKEDRYQRAHIKGARLLPWHSYLKAFDESGNRLPHVLSPEDFVHVLSKLGINAEDEVVAYDDFHGLFASRFWWVSRYYGFNNVKILNGGWHAWVANAFPVAIESAEHAEGSDFRPRATQEMNMNLDELKATFQSDKIQVWDTRRSGEYDGTEETSNRRNGHIPGAINLEWKELLEKETHPGSPRFLKPLEEIESMLKKIGITKEKTIVTHCQASIRAAFGSLVLEMLNYPNHRMYDAAMAEWANRYDTPLSTEE